MSIKATTGFRIKQNEKPLTVDELANFCSDFRKKLLPVMNNSYAKLAGKIMTQTVDRITFHLKIPEDYELGFNSTPYLCAFETIISKNMKIAKTNLRDPEFDLLCDIVFYPVDGEIIGIFDGEPTIYNILWKEQEWVIPFEYYNNTDKPDEVSDEEWDYRAGLWTKALNDWQNKLFRFKVIAPEDIGMLDKSEFDIIMQHIPTKNQRANEIFNTLLGKEFIESRPKEYHFRISDFVEFVKNYDPSRKEIIIERIKKYLLKFDSETLMTNFCELEVNPTDAKEILAV